MTDTEKPLTYRQIQEEVQKWFDDNIDKDLLRELVQKPMSPKLKEMAERADRFSLCARIEIPKDFK